MLSDEEKEALEILKSFEPDDLVECAIYLQALEKITNLIKKQSKEIEHQKEKRENQKQELAILNEKQKGFNKLVNTVNSYKGQFKRQQKEIEEAKQKEKNAYIDGTNAADKLCNKKWEDKIKAKIEEYDDKAMTVNLANRSAGKTFQQAVHYEVKKVLQSLLEKE